MASAQEKELLKDAITLHRQDRLDEAARSYQRLLSLHPKNSDALHLLGTLRFQQGKPKKALALFEQAIQITPDEALYHANLGNALKTLGDLEAALESYGRSLTLDPKQSHIRLQQGTVLRAKGALDQAEDAFKEALRLKRYQAEAQCRLGNLLLSQVRLDEAALAFEKALEARPGFSTAYYGLARAQRALGDDAAARKQLEAALAADPGCYRAKALLARLMIEEGEVALAAAMVSSLRQEAPRLAEAWAVQGDLHFKQQDRKSALEAFKQALSLDPSLPSAAAGLAQLLLLQKQSALTSQLLDKSLQSNPKDLALNIMKAEAELLSGTPETGLARLEALPLQSYGRKLQRVTLLREIAKLRDICGQPDLALKTLAEAKVEEAGGPAETASDPYSPLVRQIRKLRRIMESRAPLAPQSASNASEDPIFLIGFPRSGRAQLARLLKAHPAFELYGGRDCLSQISSFIASKGVGPDKLGYLSEEQRNDLRNLYFQGISQRVPKLEGKRLVDPSSQLILQPELMRLLFPGAKFIYCLRHPCDAVLAAFMQAPRPEDPLGDLLSLERCSDLYRHMSDYWEAAREKLGLKAYALRYEDIAKDPKGQLASLSIYLGQDLISGKSLTPLNERSQQAMGMGRWQRYRTSFTPFLHRLRPFISFYGYD